MVWLSPNLPLCRGPQRQKVKRFTGEARRRSDPQTRPGEEKRKVASQRPARDGRHGADGQVGSKTDFKESEVKTLMSLAYSG